MRFRIAFGVLIILGSAAAAQAPPPLGKLVDIGQYRLHLYCTGQGRQTVVLSPGGGDFSFDWYLVQEKLSGSTRVCSYDRAGSAWSDTGPQPATMRQEAHELRLALRKAKERGPYILVGHSLGGLVVRVFAQHYPRDTAGVVLVDATSPDTTLSLNGKLVHMRELAKDRAVPAVQTMKSSPPKSLPAEAQQTNSGGPARKIRPPYDSLPAEIQQLQLWAWSQPPRFEQGIGYLAEELRDMYQREQAVRAPLGHKPLVTIVAMRADPAPPNVPTEEWDRLFREKIAQKRAYARLSTNSKIVEARNAGHHVHLDAPQVVVDAVLEVLSALRDRSTLSQ